jgi:hypothetical protein
MQYRACLPRTGDFWLDTGLLGVWKYFIAGSAKSIEKTNDGFKVEIPAQQDLYNEEEEIGLTVDLDPTSLLLGYDDDALVYGEVNLTVAKDIVRENLTGKTPSEQDISELIDKQYPKFETLELFKKEWQNVREDLRFLQRELWDIQTLLLGEREDVLYKIARTRKDEIVTVDVIPEQYREEVESLESMFKLKAISFLVKLPYYKFHQCIRFKDADTQWTYADVEYNEDEGAIARKK